MPGRWAIEANQSWTCSTAMASTVMCPKAGRMTSRMKRRLLASVPGFQWRAWRSRNSSANAAMGRPGYLGPLTVSGVSSREASTRRASLRASGRLIALADPRVAERTRPLGSTRRRQKVRVPLG
ncbi:MAG: hypothetical protein OXF40_07635 [Rhodospirillales bacterium]|nr:hypothetical protein [Rhodospirillales bacterium]